MDCSGNAVVNAILVKKEEDKKGGRKNSGWILKKALRITPTAFPERLNSDPERDDGNLLKVSAKKQTIYFQEVKHCIGY